MAAAAPQIAQVQVQVQGADQLTRRRDRRTAQRESARAGLNRPTTTVARRSWDTQVTVPSLIVPWVHASSWRVSPALAPYVASVATYDFVSVRADGHRGLPSTAVVVVLPLEHPLNVGWWDAPGTVGSYVAVTSGLHVRPAAVGGAGRHRGIQLALTPAGARALLGLPAAALFGEIVSLPDAAPHLAQLPTRLAEAPCWAERLRLVEKELLNALGRTSGGTVPSEVAAGMHELTATASVAGVADRLGCSRRNLSTAFRGELGVSPKQFQRIARFEASRRCLMTPTRLGRPSLAAVAARLGYADQAHLTREWTALAGCPPGAWLRAER